MTDSGQPPKSSPQPPTPAWAPAPESGSRPEHGPASDIGATMRLIPVPPATVPPPPIASITTPPKIPGEHYIGKDRVKSELGRGGMGAVYPAAEPGPGRSGVIQEPNPTAEPGAL